MNNYVYIVSSLPVLTADGLYGDKTASGIISEIKEQCSDKDLELVGWIERGFDHECLNTEFYKQALCHKNAFIREYFEFDLKVRNAKVRHINKALNRDNSKDIVSIYSSENEPLNEDAELDDKIAAVMDGSDIIVRERAIDDMYWDKLDSMTEFRYFDMDVILAFIVKLHIVDRWRSLDEQTGREMFRKLVDDVRGTFKGVEFNDR